MRADMQKNGFGLLKTICRNTSISKSNTIRFSQLCERILKYSLL